METIMLVTSLAILLGLTKTTEEVLNIRQRRRDRGDDTKTFL
jgi:hypothetical protein